MRQSRLEKLNLCLAEAEEKHPGPEATAHSMMRYGNLRNVYDPIMTEFTEMSKAIPDEKFELLKSYLKSAGKCIGTYKTGNELKKQAYIMPMLIIVCSLFNDEDEVTLGFAPTYSTTNLKFTSQFDFVLERKGKRVYFVVANDMDKGLAQLLLGCEGVSNVRSDDVYGIVTTISDWTFLKSCDSEIFKHETTMLVENNVMNPDSLRNIVGIIYTMLCRE